MFKLLKFCQEKSEIIVKKSEIKKDKTKAEYDLENLVQKFSKAAFIQDAIYAALLFEKNARAGQIGQQGGNGLAGRTEGLGQHLTRK